MPSRLSGASPPTATSTQDRGGGTAVLPRQLALDIAPAHAPPVTSSALLTRYSTRSNVVTMTTSGHPESRVERYLRDEATEPMTLSQVAQAIDISRSGVYSWRERNDDRVLVVGKGRGGGELIVHVASPLAEDYRSAPSVERFREMQRNAPATALRVVSAGFTTPDAAPMVGTYLQVRGVSMGEGDTLILDLASDDGAQYTVTMQ